MIFPYFKGFERTVDLHMTWLNHRSIRMISNISELFVQNLSEYELDPELNLHNYAIRKLRCSKALKTNESGTKL